MRDGESVLSLADARKTRRRRKKPAPDDLRPVIHLTRGDIERIADESERALIAANRGVYQRDGLIVSVAETLAKTANVREVVVQRIAECGDYAVIEHLDCAAHFTKYDARARGDVTTDPPLWVVRTLRERGRLRFPILTGVINAPTLRADGSVLDAPGYDAATGLLFDRQGVEFPSIAHRPTREDARAALALLRDLIDSFPFVAEVDRAVALSGIVTALVRRSLSAAPLHAFSAPVAGSGKSKLVDIASVIATGHEAAVIAQGKTAEEFEKRIGAALLAGDPIIAIDNCEAPLGGELLCQCLTQARVKPRILGQSKAPETSTGAFLGATGNNLALVGDLARRAVLSRLDPKCERPEKRFFDRDPVAHAKSKRAALVAAALTVLHAYNVVGRPGKPPPLGSFETWSDLVRGALLWLDCADPVGSIETVRKTDPVLRNLTTLVEQWAQVLGPDRVTVIDVIKRVTQRTSAPENEPQEFAHPGFREALLAVAGDSGAINTRRLGNWLSKEAGRIVNGRCFELCGERQGVAVWRLAET
jgi:hypothetical protein